MKRRQRVKRRAEGEAKGPWKISGTINRAALIWDDGGERDVYRSTTRRIRVPSRSKASSISVTTGRAPSASSSTPISHQPIPSTSSTSDGDGVVVELAYNYAQLSHEKWGTIIAGLNDTASDEIDNINLAEADAVSDASFENFVNELLPARRGHFRRFRPGVGQSRSLQPGQR